MVRPLLRICTEEGSRTSTKKRLAGRVFSGGPHGYTSPSKIGLESLESARILTQVFFSGSITRTLFGGGSSAFGSGPRGGAICTTAFGPAEVTFGAGVGVASTGAGVAD